MDTGMPCCPSLKSGRDRLHRTPLEFGFVKRDLGYHGTIVSHAKKVRQNVPISQYQGTRRSLDLEDTGTSSNVLSSRAIAIRLAQTAGWEIKLARGLYIRTD